jgi:hypothetical protein
MTKLIAATFSVMCIVFLSGSSNALNHSDMSSTDTEQPQALVQPEVSVLPDMPGTDSEQLQTKPGVCNLSCTPCTIGGDPCPRDPDTGNVQFCVSFCS